MIYKLLCFNFSCLVVVVLILLKYDKKLMIQLEKHIQNRFPEYEAKFHTNRRNFYIHMCTDKSLFCFENYKLLLQEIDNFLTEHMKHKFTSVNPPKLIFCTRLKHDYIIYKKN